MAQNPLIKRYLDAGMAFTQMTQNRAEAIAKDLVKAGEVSAQQAQELAEQILERSRRNTDRLLETIRKEVRSQIGNMGLATKDDIVKLEKQIAALQKAQQASKPAKKAAAKKKATRKKAAAKKTAAKRS